MKAPRQRWTRWLILVVGLVAFGTVLHGADFGATAALLRSAGPLLVIGVLPYLVQIALDSLGWRLLLGALGHRVPWRRLTAIRLSTEAVLMSMPAGSIVGETLKPYLLKKTDHIPVSHTVASIGIKKCLLVFAESVYLATALVIGYQFLHDHSHAIVGVGGLPAMVGGGVVFLLAVGAGLSLAFVAGSVGDRIHRLLMRLPGEGVRNWLAARRASFTTTDSAFLDIARSSRARLAGAWLSFVAAWFAETCETFILLYLVGIDLPFTDVLVMEACVVFVRNLAFFMPAGLGIQDAGYLAFLSAYGVDANVAGAAFVIVKRLKELCWIAIGYLLLMMFEGRPNGASADDAMTASANLETGTL